MARLLDGVLSRLSNAAEGGTSRVFAAAEDVLAELTEARVAILIRAAGIWRPWHEVHDDPAPQRSPPFCIAHTLSIRDGHIVAVMEGSPAPHCAEALGMLARTIAFALELAAGSAKIARSVNEIEVMHSVAARILETHDVNDVLMMLSHETKRLLDADICGVMLREGDEVVMKSCVGHYSTMMPRLRMHSGIGVAGRVIETGTPCIVHNYVESEEISHDFVPLARIEKVRAALAVPIRSRDAVIGVLEIWRRRPLTFSSHDAPLMMALAGLASIAIDNALLLREHTETAERLATAFAELEHRYDTINRVASLQEQIAGLMMLEDALPSILDLTAEFTEAAILLFDSARQLELARPENALSKSFIVELQGQMGRLRSNGDAPATLRIEDRTARILPVRSGPDVQGWLVCVDHEEASEMVRLALRHVALAVGVCRLERRRATRQRLSSLENVLWELLSGEANDRAIARDRAREQGVSVSGEMFAAILALPLGPKRESSVLDPISHERVLTVIDQSAPNLNILLAGIRGRQLSLLCKGRPEQKQMEALQALAKLLSPQFKGLQMVIGVSGVHSDWHSLPTAYRQSLVALEVAHSRPAGKIARYEDVGIMGLLVNLRDNRDFARLSCDILGELLDEKKTDHPILIKTLNAYFDNNCSQSQTAKALLVHHKTVSYRLEKIEKLTGLDLSNHQDRMLADIGVKLFALVSAPL